MISWLIIFKQDTFFELRIGNYESGITVNPYTNAPESAFFKHRVY